jgi:hypothetical protein
MPNLLIHNRRVESIFNLLGQKENDITFSIGWVLSCCPTLLVAFLSEAFGRKVHCGNPHDLVVALQEYQTGGGITDLEIRGADLHLIVEAKRGWDFPSEQQLTKYLPRFKQTNAEQPMILTMSECSQDYAKQYFPGSVKGIPVRHLSWREMSKLASRSGGSLAEKRLMKEFTKYIATIVNMQPQESNRVYIVSLNASEFTSGLTFVQVVEERQRYFHPYGRGGWPKEPPNYIAFRYWGRLQSIHHIEKAEVIRNYHPHFPECGDREMEPHYLYHLGPAIRPAHDMKTGVGIKWSSRRWAFLDLLLTSKTISDACAASRLREGEVA